MDNILLQKIANNIRVLTVDAIEKANSGHPGMALGSAELGAFLYGELMRYDTSDPHWVCRDRFFLSAGHASMLLYSLLHLSGYKVSLEDLQAFRQLNSKTPGHPELGHTQGVEATTGPLGQGLANAVGCALAETRLASLFNTKGFSLIEHFSYVLVGDGCLMEGITSEASSLAGHWGLGRLIVFYDSNRITIDGSTDLAFTEDVAARYRAYGWQVLEADPYDFDSLRAITREAQNNTKQASLIILRTLIGKGAPHKAGSHKVHGAPLGPDEAKLLKESLGVPAGEDFYLFPGVYEAFREHQEQCRHDHKLWSESLEKWKIQYPEKKALWDAFFTAQENVVSWPHFQEGQSVATRNVGEMCLNAASVAFPFFFGGSADLAESNKTFIKDGGSYSIQTPLGKNIHYGVREHAMSAIANGIQAHSHFRTFVSTFLVFSDYLRAGIRMSALSHLPVTYVLTHDSIYVGEDGPTHQPIEHLNSLRLIPNFYVARPADAEEVVVAWDMAIKSQKSPWGLLLTRQNLPAVLPKRSSWENDIRQYGAHIVSDAEKPEITLLSSGSEVSLALEALKMSKRRIRLISVVCMDLLLEKRDQIASWFEGSVVVVEAAAGCLWPGVHAVYGIQHYGASAKAEELAASLGFTPQALLSWLDQL